MTGQALAKLVAALATALLAYTPVSGKPTIVATPTVAWPNECRTLPGYQDFRLKLETVVAERDALGLRSLFHPKGSMRINGVGIRSGESWGFDKPEAVAAWSEIDEILRFGCAARRGQAILPAMAGLVEDGSVDPEFYMVTHDTGVRQRPNLASKVIRRLKRGELIFISIYNHTPGWHQALIRKRSGFVRVSDTRSPHSYQMVLIQEAGRWYIREVTTGV